MKFIFSIEGNIGSGKSSYVKFLKENYKKISGLQVIYLPEPVKSWEKIKDETTGENIIEKFYKDQTKYSFSFQMMAYISRIKQLKDALSDHENVIIITERSVFTDKNVFASMLREDGKMEEIEYKIYNEWFNYFTKDVKINGIIYLNASAEVCEKRVIQRNRKGENIPLEYLKKCNQKHDDWLLNDEHTLKLNADDDWVSNENQYMPPKNHVSETVKYIKGVISKSYAIMKAYKYGLPVPLGELRKINSDKIDYSQLYEASMSGC